MLCFACVCGFLIYEILEKWQKSPVVMGIDKDPTPIYRIPFPAVTICPETKINRSVFEHEHAQSVLNRAKIEKDPSIIVRELTEEKL